jgi:hypothetical protein
VIFRVRIDSLEQDRIYEGLDGECEFLIEGTVENVEVSEDEDDDS